MSPKPDVSEERKEQIMNAAWVVFAQSGFHKARMDDIAKQAGLSKGTLYLYFKSKDELGIALLDRMFALELEGLQSLLAQDGPIRKRLFSHWEKIATQLEELGPLSAVWYEFYAETSRQPQVQRYFKGYFVQFRGVVEEIVRQGIEREELRQVDPGELAMVLVSLSEGATLMWSTDPSGFDLRKLGQSALGMLFEGVSLH